MSSIKRGNRAVDIGATLSLKNLDSQAAPRSESPRTAVGELLGERRQYLEQDNARLTSRVADLESEVKQWSEALPVVQLDPKLVEPSRFANRLEESFASKDFSLFKDEIVAAGGNVQPIKVAAIPGTNPQRYSIIYGHRRHRACLESSLPVNAIIENLDDRSQFVEMDRENRGRRDLSPFEQGIWYLRAVTPVTQLTPTGDAGWAIFSSKYELANALGLDRGNVTKACQIAELPSVVLDAFPSRNEIQFNWATALHREITTSKAEVIARANDVLRKRNQGEGFSSKDVFLALTTTESTAQEIGPSVVEIVSRSGAKAAKVIRDKQGRTRIEFTETLDEKYADKIIEFLGKLL